MKAQYVGKFTERSYGNFVIHMEYIYRGEKYEVIEDRNRGNEPLAWQHKHEQAMIDKKLDTVCKSRKCADDVETTLKKLLELWEK